MEMGEIKNFTGLFKQANSLIVPDGALEECQNAVVRNTGRVDRRRGFYQVYDPGVAVPNRLFYYEDRVSLGTETNGMFYFTETGSDPNKTFLATANGGEAFTLDGRVSRSAEAAKNLYFTTNEGVMKLTAYNSDVEMAGVPPGLDLRGVFIDANGSINVGQVAYRAVFGKRDANDNLLLGSPGDALVLTNSEKATLSYTNPSGNLVEVTDPAKHNLSVGMAITVSNASDSGLDGTQVVTAVISDFVYRFDKGSAVSPGSGTLDFSATRTTRLEISIPAEIDAGQGYFVQLYRSSQSGNEDISPFGDYKLVMEHELSSTEVSTGVVFIDDDIPDLLLGAELYTNENSQEGELQANARPPLAADITEFKEHLIYANVRTRHRASLSVIDSSAFSSGSYIQIRIGGVVRKYIARSGVGNTTVKSETIAGTTTITITYTSHGLLNGDIIRISSIVGTALPGEYGVFGVTANTFQITVGSGLGATSLYFQGVENSSGEYLWSFDNTSSSLSVQLRNTALGLVKAINRDDNGLVYATYASGISDVPGQISIEAQGFTDPIEFIASSNSVGAGFDPTLTTSYQTLSENDELPHVIYVSKIGEREAVPLVNFFEIGARNQPLLRVAALQDSLILVKRDGVYRLVGDTVNDFAIAPLDTTLDAINPSYVSLLNNQVMMMTNQGFAAVTDSAVRIISHRIEDIIQPIVSKDGTETEGGSVGYESDRLYLVSTLGPNDSSLTTTYAYNALTDAWSEWDVLFKQGVVGPNDTLYLIRDDNKIIRERKLFTKLDYSDQNYSATIDSVASDLLSVVATISVVPEQGDVLVKNQVISRVRSVESLGGSQYNLTLRNETNLVATDVVQIYDAFKTTIKLAPFHAGQVGRMKHFAECQIHFRAHAISRAVLRFAGSYQNSSIETEWVDTNITGIVGSDGWGYSPWGFFPWGNVNEEQLVYGTQAVPIIRTYVPQGAARNPFIQLIFEHNEAAEPAEMQAVSYSVRAYSNRVTR